MSLYNFLICQVSLALLLYYPITLPYYPITVLLYYFYPMRHLRKGKKFGRMAKTRNAFFKALMVAFVEHGKIRTTLSRAKAIQPQIEKIITQAKDPKISVVRNTQGKLGNSATKKLIKEWVPALKDRKGGYTRIIKLAPRKSDASPMAYIEFVGGESNTVMR